MRCRKKSQHILVGRNRVKQSFIRRKYCGKITTTKKKEKMARFNELNHAISLSFNVAEFVLIYFLDESHYLLSDLKFLR